MCLVEQLTFFLQKTSRKSSEVSDKKSLPARNEKTSKKQRLR